MGRSPVDWRRAAGAAGLAAASVAASAALAEPSADVRGLPEGEALDRVRAAAAQADGRPDSAFEARRRAETARSRVIAALRAEGYYAARVSARAEQDERGHLAVVEVEAGTRFTISGLSVAVSQAPDDVAQAVRGALGLAPGEPLRAEAVLAAETRGVAALEGQGYPDAFVAPREVIVDHASAQATVALVFIAGERAALGSVQATGEGRISPAFLERVADFEPAAPYDRAAIDTLSQRLRASGAYDSVRVSLGPPEGAAGDRRVRPVLVDLSEGPRRTLALGASFATSEGAGVEAEWRKRNLFGGTESLAVTARVQTIERFLGAELTAPHWRRVDRTLRLLGSAVQEETDAFDRTAVGLGVRLEQPVRPRLSASLGLDVALQEETEPGDASRRFTRLAGAAGLAYDDTDDPLDPSRGVRLAASLGPAGVFGDETLAYLTSALTASAYRALGDERLIGAVRGRVASIVGAEAGALPVDARFFAGGGGSVRGYEFQSLSPRDADGALEGGASLVELAAEARWRVRERFGLVAFVDGGAATRDPAPAFDALRWAAGLGLRYYAGFGPLRADIAIPLDADEDDPAFQLYLSIGQAF